MTQRRTVPADSFDGQGHLRKGSALGIYIDDAFPLLLCRDLTLRIHSRDLRVGGFIFDRAVLFQRQLFVRQRLLRGDHRRLFRLQAEFAAHFLFDDCLDLPDVGHFPAQCRDMDGLA